MANIKETRTAVFNLAHEMKRRNQFLSWSQCLAASWKVVKLQTAMRQGKVSFVYQKQNGDRREAKGTLVKELIPYSPKGNAKPQPITLVKYYDLGAEGYRSFRAERILEIAA